jgi:glycerophosphoryl diester phosphodiesterase
MELAMRCPRSLLILFFSPFFLSACNTFAPQDDDSSGPDAGHVNDPAVQLGPRPFYLVNDMDEGELKTALQQCASGPFYKTDFSIGHRGAPLQFPEHTRESYQAAAVMGAGIVECDATFTQDKELVCRHSQCDLHTTTNIVATELNQQCTQPFTPANPDTGEPASAMCCTSDITLAEFKTLKGKMDASNPAAITPEEYLGGTADWRTDLYATGTLLSHAESIELFKELDVKFTPELKEASVDMPYQGTYTQADYAQQLIDEYKAAGVSPSDVWPQSFNRADVVYWLSNTPEFGEQAVFLDENPNEPAYVSETYMNRLVDQGINIVAPPIWKLLALNGAGEIVPSEYARNARAAGLDIIAWTAERDGPLKDGGGWYHQSISQAIDNDGDTMKVLDVLAKDVGVIGVFSDWPATVTYYANCMGF